MLTPAWRVQRASLRKPAQVWMPFDCVSLEMHSSLETLLRSDKLIRWTMIAPSVVLLSVGVGCTSEGSWFSGGKGTRRSCSDVQSPASLPGVGSWSKLLHWFRRTLQKRCYFELRPTQPLVSGTANAQLVHRDGSDLHWRVNKNGWEFLTLILALKSASRGMVL